MPYVLLLKRLCQRKKIWWLRFFDASLTVLMLLAFCLPWLSGFGVMTPDGFALGGCRNVQAVLRFVISFFSRGHRRRQNSIADFMCHFSCYRLSNNSVECDRGHCDG
jgi:hypothetical protein